MQIGNIDLKQIRLETDIEQSFEIRNKKLRLDTQKLDWKQNKYIGNNRFRLERFTNMQGHKFKDIILQDLAQIQVQIAG